VLLEALALKCGPFDQFFHQFHAGKVLGVIMPLRLPQGRSLRDEQVERTDEHSFFQLEYRIRIGHGTLKKGKGGIEVIPCNCEEERLVDFCAVVE